MKDDEAVGWTLVLALARVAELEHESAKLKRALGKIYHHVAEEWQDDYYVDSACLFTYLKEAGYESPDGEGEPEPFIHGDSDSGAEG